jgi:hypothetical protein
MEAVDRPLFGLAMLLTCVYLPRNALIVALITINAVATD